MASLIWRTISRRCPAGARGMSWSNASRKRGMADALPSSPNTSAAWARSRGSSESSSVEAMTGMPRVSPLAASAYAALSRTHGERSRSRKAASSARSARSVRPTPINAIARTPGLESSSPRRSHSLERPGASSSPSSALPRTCGSACWASASRLKIARSRAWDSSIASGAGPGSMSSCWDPEPVEQAPSASTSTIDALAKPILARRPSRCISCTILQSTDRVPAKHRQGRAPHAT